MASIVIDLDGVMADFIRGFNQLSFELGLFDAKIRDHRNSEILLGDEEAQVRTWEEIAKRPWWWLELPVAIDGREIDMIRELQAEHQVIFCTSRKAGTPHPQLQAVEWLGLAGLPESSVVCSQRKEEIASGVNASYVLDDSLGVVNYIGPPCRTYVLDRPYNRKGREDWVREVKRVEKFLRDVKNWV